MTFSIGILYFSDCSIVKSMRKEKIKLHAISLILSFEILSTNNCISSKCANPDFEICGITLKVFNIEVADFFPIRLPSFVLEFPRPTSLHSDELIMRISS
jgi:hypothetical protein